MVLSGRLLSYFKKRKISRNGHSLSFVVTRCTTRYNWLSFVFTRTTRCHSIYLPLVCLLINDPKSTISTMVFLPVIHKLHDRDSYKSTFFLRHNPISETKQQELLT